MIFTSDSGCANKLNHEVETYSAATGAVNNWVKVPTISHTSDTVFYMCYGNSGIMSDQSNKTAVWDANYKGVWHMADNAANTALADSTSNANNLTNTADTNSKTTSARINGGLSYDGSTDNSTTGSLNLSGSALTLSMWVDAATFQSNFPYISSLIGEEVSGSGTAALIRLGDASLANNKAQFVLEIGGSQVKLDGVTGLSAGTWTYVAATSSIH